MIDNLLQPIDRFHQELRSLTAAGIDVDLGTQRDGASLAAALDQFRAALRVRLSFGQSLPQALEQEDRLPERYRAAAQAWLGLESPDAVLQAVTASYQIDRRVKRNIRLALMQTTTLLVLVCIALAVAAVWLSPKIDALYHQLNLVPPPSAQTLSALRQWLPIWSSAAAGVVLVIGLMWMRSGDDWVSRWAMRLPMVRRRHRIIRHARFAQYLAVWLHHDPSLQRAMVFASALSGSRVVESHSGSTAMADTPDEPPRSETSSQGENGSDHHLPPLLAWAVAYVPPDESQAAVLQSVAEVYRRLADRQITFWTRWIPTMLAALLGGLAVLLYGLSVFLPIIHLLHAVSLPGNI